MLNTLFNPEDVIEIRCLHKDQIKKEGRYEPEPHIFWGSINEHKARYTELTRLNGIGYNIYFGANPRIGRSKNAIAGCRALFVDIDHMDAAEAETWLDVVMTEWSVPYPSVKICSGNGIHFYWRLKEQLSTADWSEHQRGLIGTFNLTSKVADPVIFDPPRIMRVPGFVNHRGGAVASVLENRGDVYSVRDFRNCLENVPVKAAPVSAPDPNYQGDNSNSLERALRYHEKREGCSEGGRNGEAYKIAACCQNDFALSAGDCYHVISVWNMKNRPPLPESEIREVISKAKQYSAGSPDYSKDRPKPTPNHGPTPTQTIEPEDNNTMDYSDNDYNEQSGPNRTQTGLDLEILSYMVENYVLVAGTCDIWDLEHGIRMPASALSLLFPREFKTWKSEPARKVILDENLVFEPSGIIKEGQINTFQGFRFEEDNRPMPMLLSHLEFLCNDDSAIMNWVMSWCALQVQQPGTKLATSLIFHGKQGTGKSMFWECFGRIFDPYFAVIDQNVLESDFNSWASRRMFVLAEEVLANQSKGKLKNVVKQMVTGGRIQINEKNVKAWWETCYMNLVFNSNNRLPMLLDEDDRRFMVIRCDRKQSEEYYTELAAEISDNGPARLCSMLKAWKLDGFNAHTKPLFTKAKSELIKIIRDSCKVFLDEWLAGDIDGLPATSAKKQDLYDAYVGYCKAAGMRSNSQRHFYSIIEDEYPELTERKTAYYRFYLVGQVADINPFNDSAAKYLYKIQDRRV